MYTQRFYEGDMLKSVQDELNRAERILRSQIDKITQLSNEFYAALRLNAQDSYLIASDGVLEFNLAGAKEFEKKYLMNKDQPTNSVTQRLLNVMNTKKYQQACVRVAQLKLKDPKWQLSAEKAKEFKDLIALISKDLSVNFLKKVVPDLTEVLASHVTQALAGLMESKEKRTASGTTKGLYFKPKVEKRIKENLDSNEIMKQIFTDEGSSLNLSTNKSHAETAKENFEKYFLEIGLDSTVQIMWDILISFDPGIKTQIKEDHFKHFFYTELKNYGKTNFNIESPAFTGMQLEQPFIFGINIDLEAFFKNSLNKIKARGIGQQLETKTYADNSEGTYMSGTDFYFDVYDSNGKVTNSYRIQAKNSFVENNYLSIRLQDKIKLQTYADRIFEKDSIEKKNLFEYLLLNRAFLTQYGLMPGSWKKYGEQIELINNANEYKYMQSLHKELEGYIQFFLNETIAYLIGGKVYEAAKENWNVKTQNLFFIYKGKYLIPVSLFLYSAYRLIAFLKEDMKIPANLNNGIHIDGTIGELTYSAKLEGVNVGMAFARQLRSDKYYYLNHRTDVISQEDSGMGVIFDSGYRYPENLVAIGHEAGEKLLKTASFPQINFRTHLKEIDSLLKII